MNTIDLLNVCLYWGNGGHIVIYCQGCNFLLTGAPSPEAAMQIAEWHRTGLMQASNGLARPRNFCGSAGIVNALENV